MSLITRFTTGHFKKSLFSSVHELSRTFSRSLFIRTEETPNDNAIKFLPGVSLSNQSLDLTSNDFTDAGLSLPRFKDTSTRMLVKSLFNISGVRGVMFGPDFVTVTKAPDVNWAVIKPDVYAALADGLSALNGKLLSLQVEDNGNTTERVLSPTEQSIVDLLNTRIRPAVQSDGGDVEFVSFDAESGIVTLSLHGACRSCPSSNATLQYGVRNMIMHYIPEVTDVVQEA